MLDRYSYLQKRAALDKLGSQRKLAMLTKVAIPLKAFNAFLRTASNGGKTFRFAQALSAMTPAERLKFVRTMNDPKAMKALGVKNVDATRLQELNNEVNRLGMNTNTGVFGVAPTGQGRNGMVNLSNAGEGYGKNRVMFDSARGELVNMDKGQATSLIKSTPYTGADGYNMPVYNPQTGTYTHVAMSPEAATELDKYYRSEAGKQFLQGTGMGGYTVVQGIGGPSKQFQSLIQGKDWYSMDPQTQMRAYNNWVANQQLAQAQAEYAKYMQQMQGTFGVPGQKPSFANATLKGIGTVAGIGGAGLWGLSALGNSSRPKGTEAYYEPMTYNPPR